MYGCVYKITNLMNGKVYIGQTTETPKARFHRHANKALHNKRGCTYLYAAIRKYGPEEFWVEKIADAPTKEELDVLEIRLIAEHQATNRAVGYNICPGGSVPTMSSEARERLRETMKTAAHNIGNLTRGKPRTPESIENMKAAWERLGMRPKPPVAKYRPIIYLGQTYPGLRALANAFGVSVDVVRIHVNLHHPTVLNRSRHPLNFDELGFNPIPTLKIKRPRKCQQQ
jgi:hypothetical protein